MASASSFRERDSAVSGNPAADRSVIILSWIPLTCAGGKTIGLAARHFGMKGAGLSDQCRGMDLADLIERNAAFTPDKAAIRFAGAALSYAAFAATDRGGGGRVAVRSWRSGAATGSPSWPPTIPIIWCCCMPARGWAPCWCRSTGGWRCRSSSTSCATRARRCWWSSRRSRRSSRRCRRRCRTCASWGSTASRRVGSRSMRWSRALEKAAARRKRIQARRC